MSSTVVHTGTSPTNGFQQAVDEECSDTCGCPIHAGRDREPFTAPLGLPFADRVSVEEIGAETAGAIYDAHHSYIDGVPDINLAHHGIRFRGNLVGAVTWRYPFMPKRRVRYDEAGDLLPDPISIEDDIPEQHQLTAGAVLKEISEADVASSEVVAGDKFLEASRICLGVQMPNLASAALARSQERIVADYEHRGIRFLRTLVRADFPATMLRALQDKGWTCTGVVEPEQASNRETKAIRDEYKWRFCCPVERVREQSTLARWC